MSAQLTTSKTPGRTGRDEKLLQIIGYILLTAISLFCLVPFILVLSSSLTEESSIIKDGYQLFPSVFSLEAYKLLFEFPGQLIRAYTVTISVTVVGTVVGLFLTSMTAYALARKDFKWRNGFSFFSSSLRCSVVVWFHGIS